MKRIRSCDNIPEAKGLKFTAYATLAVQPTGNPSFSVIDLRAAA